MLAQFADAMASVGRGVELRFEKLQIEEVLGLGGGELNAEPIEFISRRRNHWDELDDWERRFWRYSYDGAPEWARDDFGGRYGYDSSEYFTLIEVGCTYESYAPDELFFPGAPLWCRHYFRVEQYTNDGERECPESQGEDGDQKVGEGYTEGMQRCPMCDEKAGDEHGYIYLGTCAETVYRRVDFECAECGLARSEMLEHGLDACQCEEDQEDEDAPTP